MEPISMLGYGAATVFATKVLEEAGSQTGRGLSAAAVRLVAWLRGEGRKDGDTGAAIAMVQAAPSDQSRIDVLAEVLAVRARSDPAFASDMRELVSDAQDAGDLHHTLGGAHIHGSVWGGHVTQVAGNQYQRPSRHS